MLLKDRFIHIGHFFFRYRSYQPLLLLLVLLEEREHFYHITDNIYYEVFCILIAFSGLLIRILTVGFVHEWTSGRNTKTQKAEELNTTGAYSIVRNPLYLGNYLILLGISLLAQNYEVVILNTVIFVLLYTTIIFTEESFLLEKFGEKYLEYTKHVNCIWPSFKKLKKPERKFRIKIVLKREHDTWLTTMLSIGFVELLREYGASGIVTPNLLWIILIGSSVLIWGILKLLKKSGKFVIRAD